MDSELIPSFENIFSLKNLLAAYLEFRKGKKQKKDVAYFATGLVSNLTLLKMDLLGGKYKHGGYLNFKINDPKPRDIHKASVRDRVVHHAIVSALRDYFEGFFIHDSYSCRVNKGTHRALNRFEEFSRKITQNYTLSGYVLKCDIQKCFASINQQILKKILRKHINCDRTFSVLETIIDSFYSGTPGRGLPLGNLTSQLFINIYLNELDQYVKRKLKVRFYIRYSDDFVLFSKDIEELKSFISPMHAFLTNDLKVRLHPKKISISSVYSGVDFLGWVHFKNHRVLRSNTKKRMFRKLEKGDSRTKASYLGLLSHGNSYKLSRLIEGERMI